MQILHYYKCDSCGEIHAESENVFECKICAREICDLCSEKHDCEYVRLTKESEGVG